MPLSPRKCWGKKVRFTPTNIMMKCVLVQREWRVSPENRGNQWVNPLKMANTAPMERT